MQQHPIHHCLDVVDLVTVHLDVFIQLVYHAINPGAHEPRFADLLQNCLVGAFAPAHQWGEDQ